MSEFKNQAEVLQALLDGKIVQCIDNLALYKVIEGSIRRIDKGHDYHVSVPFMYFDKYRIYVGPKKKKTIIVAPAAYKNSFGEYGLSIELFSSLEAAKKRFGDDFCAWLNVEMPIKVEVDDE